MISDISAAGVSKGDNASKIYKVTLKIYIHCAVTANTIVIHFMMIFLKILITCVVKKMLFSKDLLAKLKVDRIMNSCLNKWIKFWTMTKVWIGRNNLMNAHAMQNTILCNHRIHIHFLHTYILKFTQTVLTCNRNTEKSCLEKLAI